MKSEAVTSNRIIMRIEGRVLCCAVFMIIILFSFSLRADTFANTPDSSGTFCSMAKLCPNSSWGLFPDLSCSCTHLLDGECTKTNSLGNKNPIKVNDCSGGMCAICENGNYFQPSAEVLYMVGTYTWTGPGGLKMPIYRKTISMYQCDWLLGIRFCVRPTRPKASSDPSGYPTTDVLIPRHEIDQNDPKLCAYEDPCDGMDPPDGNCAKNSKVSPFTLYTPNIAAISMAKAASIGAIAGAPFALSCPPCAAFSVVTAVLVAAIQQTYNQVITSFVGCIPREIGPMPPTWSNNAWWNNYAPTPTFSDAGTPPLPIDNYPNKATKSSVFETPVVDIRVCRNGENISARMVDCHFTNAKTDATSSAQITLNSNEVAGCSGDNSTASPYCACKTVDYTYSYTSVTGGSTVTNTLSSNTYCAQITKDKPDVIAINLRGGSSPNYTYSYIREIPRPGYIPKPTIATASNGNANMAGSLNVTLRGANFTLTEQLYQYTKHGITYLCNPQANTTVNEPNNPLKGTTLNGYCFDGSGSTVNDPDPTKLPKDWTQVPQAHPSSDYLYQVQFAISRPCDGELKDKKCTDPNTNNQYDCKICEKYKDMVCLNGYETAPYAAVDNLTKIAILGKPNIQNNNVSKGTRFPNIVSNQENGQYLSESYANDVWAYPYTVDTTANPQTSKYSNSNYNSTYTVKPLSPNEAGLCVKTAPDQSDFVYTIPHDYTFTVPANCSKIKMQLWGGGGAGRWNFGGNDDAGGGGGYISGHIDNPPAGGIIKITVGGGGANMGDNGQNSSVSLNQALSPGGDNPFWGSLLACGGYGGNGDSLPNCPGVGLSAFDLDNQAFQKDLAQDGVRGGSSNTDKNAGGAAYQPDGTFAGQPADSCSNRNVNGTQIDLRLGGGGCSLGESGAFDCSDGEDCTRQGIRLDDGSWGKGGNGMVIIQCVQ